MRSTAREAVFKLLYSQLFNQNDEGLFTLLKVEGKLSEEDGVFADELYSYVKKDEDEFNEFIKANSVSFKLNRVFPADKCAMFVGMAELKNYPQTDLPIIIDEAVKLSAKYSTEKSTDFVNGILAKYAKEINRG